MKINKSIPFDIWSFKEEDLDNFYWPTNQFQLLIVRERFENCIISLIKDEKCSENKSILKIIFNILINEYLSLYENIYVLNYFKNKNYKIKYNNENYLWNKTKHYLEENAKYEEFYRINGLKFQTTKYLKHIVKKIINCTIFHNSYTFNANILTLDYLSRNRIKYSTTYPAKIFSKVKANTENSELSIKLSKGIYKVFISSLKECNSDYISLVVNTINKRYIALTRCYFRALYHQCPENINIYSGTGSNYYTRVIGEIAANKNGHLHCFEHGEGKFFYNTVEIMYNELGIANKYYTFTEASKNMIDRVNQENLINYGKKEIIPVDNKAFHLNQMIKKGQTNNYNNKNIIYVANAFRANKTCIEIRLPDIVYVEWQNFLISNLVAANYNVYIKYHPGSILANKDYQPIKNVKYLKGKLSDYFNENCIFIIDYPMTTTFGELLVAKKKILFIKMPFPKIHNEVIVDLNIGVEVIHALYDDKNRIRINNDELLLSLEKASNSDSSYFITKYYGIN